jgi:hypothetical protein
LRSPATELTHEVLECTPRGTLNPEAVGWSRRPLHRCNLTGRWPRKKRWDYWCVTSRESLLSITYTSLDYVGIVDVWFMDFATKQVTQKSVALPFAPGFSLPETVNGGDIRFRKLGLEVELLVQPDGNRLKVKFGSGQKALDADLFVALPPGHETLNVLVPWSERLFQFTSKHTSRPANGVVKLGERTYVFGAHNAAFGALDFGRGIWPYASTWNWAAASGVQGGRSVGLNLGGKWTDGTGATENGLCLDGRLHKVDEDLEWTYDRKNWLAPWRIRAPSGRVDLVFTPFFQKQGALNLAVLATELHVQVGHFEGTVVTGDGERVAVSQLLGWAEEHRARW